MLCSHRCFEPVVSFGLIYIQIQFKAGGLTQKENKKLQLLEKAPDNQSCFAWFDQISWMQSLAKKIYILKTNLGKLDFFKCFCCTLSFHLYFLLRFYSGYPHEFTLLELILEALIIELTSFRNSTS